MTATHASPPYTLDRPLEVSPQDWSRQEFYQLMTALVIPRPIGWISTISAGGVSNVAPYSYFNLMGSDPFYVAFSSHYVKDTIANLREVPQFVCNIVSMQMLEKMNFTAADFPRDQDEFEWAGLSPVASVKVRPLRVGEAPAHLECEVMQIVEDGDNHIVLGRIVHAHVEPRVWNQGRVDPRLLDPVCRLSGSAYAALGEIINVARPEWKNIKGTGGQSAMPRALKR